MGGKAKAKGTGKRAPSLDEGYEKGDLFIWDLWTQGTDIINGMHVVNTDTISYQYKTTKNFLETPEWDNKKKYRLACLNKRQRFTPFVTSVDVILGVKVDAMFK